MALKQFTTDFQRLSSSPNIRLCLPFENTKSKYPLGKITDSIETVESGSRPKGGIIEIEKGALSLGGEQINPKGFIELPNAPLIPFEYYERSNKGRVKKYDILVCKDGALTGKSCFADIEFPIKEVMINEHVYLIRSNPTKCNQKFLFYLIRNGFVQRQIRNLAYKKRGQPGLNSEHLKQIKIPQIPKPTQDEIISRIESIEGKIKKLKTIIKEPQEIMNRVFAKEFNFNLNNIYSFERIKQLTATNLGYRNEQIRNGYRWFKIKEIQNLLYKNNAHINRLGKFIQSIRNGWSPNCKESANLYAVFGVDALSKDTIISYNNLKYTNETKVNTADCLVKKGDFFVSRGNTTDLVALASIAELPNDKLNIIFPDLFIRLKFDESNINKRYIAYLFNSIIGRLYFKYSAKGKNQTMVKISSSELNNFYLPIPSLPSQQEIVNKIKRELDNQEEVNKIIDTERSKIDELIEESIK